MDKCKNLPYGLNLRKVFYLHYLILNTYIFQIDNFKPLGGSYNFTLKFVLNPNY